MGCRVLGSGCCFWKEEFLDDEFEGKEYVECRKSLMRTKDKTIGVNFWVKKKSNDFIENEPVPPAPVV